MEKNKKRGKGRCMQGLLLVLSFLFSFVFLFSPVLAVHEEGHPAEEFDYADGDYSQIDWNSFTDWSQIPPQRIPEVPAEFLEYASLSAAQRWQMNVEQVAANFNSIWNLATDVNPARAQQALREQYGVEVGDLGRSSQIRNDILTATFGEQETLELSRKDGWKIDISDDGRILVVGTETISADSIARQDRFTVYGPSSYITEFGERVAVDGISFEGTQAYVRPSDVALVDTYDISSLTGKVNVYFDADAAPAGTEEESYVLIADDRLELGSTQGNTVSVDVRPGNALFNMVRRDYSTEPPTLVPDRRDTLRITVADGDRIVASSREAEGKTPLVQHEDGGGSAYIVTGRMAVRITEDGNIKVQPPSPIRSSGQFDMKNSAAFELVTSRHPGRVLRTSSSNRFEFRVAGSPAVGEELTGKLITGTDMGLIVSDSLEANRMKSMEDLRRKYPFLEFGVRRDVAAEIEGVQIDEPSSNMVQIVDQWIQLHPDKAQRLRGIGFDGQFNALTGKGEFFGYFLLGEQAFDAPSLQRNPIRRGNPLGILDHEYIHVHDNGVELAEARLVENGRITPAQVQAASLQQHYNHIAEALGVEVVGSPAFQRWQETVRRAADQAYNEYLAIQGRDVPLLEKILVDMRRGYLSEAVSLPSSNQHYPSLITAYDALLRNLAETDSQANEHVKSLQRVVERETLLFPYAFELNTDTGDYYELSTLYQEINRNQVRGAIAQGNPHLRDLTQLAYDSGKIDPEEYGYRMGGYCQHSPCGKCLLYTLTCKE